MIKIKNWTTLLFLLCCVQGYASESTQSKLIYTFPIREDIMPSAERLTGKCLRQAEEMGADLIIIQMNTYGGMVTVADSIRTMLLESPIPVWVLIDHQAASAGALIALAADSIYIRPGGSIGAASVVDQSGKPMPDKFQSFMRATMRATAESHGKVIDRIDGQDTLWRWHRDPRIAEAMVGTSSSGSMTLHVLTLTADEAIEKHFSEGKASSVKEILDRAGIKDYTLYEYRPTTFDRIMGWMMNPVAQGIFILLIVGGIYFELQTPGIGFALIVAVIGATLYFAPLYLEGLVQYWELILFLIGLGLLAVEIFVLPGFGIAGIAGITAVVISLSFAAIDNELLPHVSSGELPLEKILSPFAVVIVSVTVGLIGALWLSRRLLHGNSALGRRLVLTTDMIPEQGYVGHRFPETSLIGKHGTVTTVLRPSGKILLEGSYYDAVADNGQFIDKGEDVVVVRMENSQLYCKSASAQLSIDFRKTSQSG